MVMYDERAVRVVTGPDAAVCEELGEAEATQELVEALLLDASGIAPAGHVARDTKEVHSTGAP